MRGHRIELILFLIIYIRQIIKYIQYYHTYVILGLRIRVEIDQIQIRPMTKIRTLTQNSLAPIKKLLSGSGAVNFSLHIFNC